MSSNLISRSNVNAFTKSFLLQLILDTRIEYLGSFLLYWKFSPYTSTVDLRGAWSVELDGDLINGYNSVYFYSYGPISPGTENIDWGFRVLLDGDVRYINTLVINSYGNFIL